MAKNTGKEYEEFVEAIYQALTKDDRFTKVEHNVKLKGMDGSRQIDVLLRSEVANISLLTAIECRDYQRRLSVKHVDGLHSKLQDVNVSKGVLVSRRGFSNTAKRKASRVGITLCLASDANSVHQEIKREIPVMVRRIEATFDLEVTIKVIKSGKCQYDMNNVVINELKILDQLNDELVTGQIQVPTVDSQIVWVPKNLKLPHIIKKISGEGRASISNMKIMPKFRVSYYYGHLSDIPDLTSIHQFDSDSTAFLFREKDYPNIIPSLTKYKSKADIPPNYRITLNLISCNFGSFNAKLKNPKHTLIKLSHQKK